MGPVGRDDVEMGVVEARANFAAVINAAVRGRTTYVTSHGRRVALVGPLTLDDDLHQLQGLLARGVLTQAMFEQARARLGGD